MFSWNQPRVFCMYILSYVFGSESGQVGFTSRAGCVISLRQVADTAEADHTSQNSPAHQTTCCSCADHAVPDHAVPDHAVLIVQGYEPHVVLSKQLMPWFDERIHNSSLGRRLFGEHLHALGQGFVVHPSAFVLRQPLLGTAPPAAINQKAQKADVWSCPLCDLCVSFPYDQIAALSWAGQFGQPSVYL